MVDAVQAGAVLQIDLDALVANWRAIGASAAPAVAAAVVKADAYGLGAVPVARALAAAGCRHFFVAHLSEAVALQWELPAGASLYVLNGLMPGAEAACAAIGAVPVLNSLDQLERWAALGRAGGRALPAVLQVDTGMSRLGLPADEVARLIAEPALRDGIDLRYVMSHLACADEPGHGANAEQVAAFERICAAFPGVQRALDNSAGALAERSHFDLVRPGIALYGGAPFGQESNPMRPVVRLEARIVQLRTVPAGAGVGYGLTFTTPRETRLATLAVGYADGWPWHLANKGSAFVAGVRVPVVGRVSMDSMTVDVTGVPAEHLYPGAPVELIGPHQSLEDAARDAGTIDYEILTRVGHRYARVYNMDGATASDGD
jgi:alanine racemase